MHTMGRRSRLVNRPSKYKPFPVVVTVTLTPTLSNVNQLDPVIRRTVLDLASDDPRRVVVYSPTDVLIKNKPVTSAA